MKELRLSEPTEGLSIKRHGFSVILHEKVSRCNRVVWWSEVK